MKRSPLDDTGATAALIGSERGATVAAHETLSVDYRDYVYDPEDPRIAAYRPLDLAGFSRERLAIPVVAATVAEWRRNLDEPYRGVGVGGVDAVAAPVVLPGEEAPVAAMRAAAEELLARLDPAQRERIAEAADSPRWRTWSNPEFVLYDCGVRLDELADDARAAVRDLIGATLGAAGAAQVLAAMEVNHRLGQILQLPEALNRHSYHLVLRGETASSRWGWQLYGHHVAISAVVEGDALTVAPVFLGAEPDIPPEGADEPIFAERERLARAFAASLRPDQLARLRDWDDVRSAAMPPERLHPLDERMLAGAFQDNLVLPAEGLPAADLDDLQQALLLDLVRDCLRPLPNGTLRRRMREIAAHLADTRITWIGQVESGPVYFRIQGPAVLVEFDHHAGVWLANQVPATFHVHTVQRIPGGRDYGGVLAPAAAAAQPAPRTVQRRRYVLAPDLIEPYVAWWREAVVPLRIGAGFRIDSATLDRESGDFVWDVSAPGTAEDFLQREHGYHDSAARRVVFDGVPDWVVEMQIGFVEDVLAATPMRREEA